MSSIPLKFLKAPEISKKLFETLRNSWIILKIFDNTLKIFGSKLLIIFNLIPLKTPKNLKKMLKILKTLYYSLEKVLKMFKNSQKHMKIPENS
jgi:hypothetical protein